MNDLIAENGHQLYEAKDFTQEEFERRNQLAVMVIEGGLGVCKICGGAEIELDETCERRMARSRSARK